MDIDGRLVGKTLQGLRDVHEGQFGLVNRVKFVDGKDDGRHPQQLEQQAVPAGLGQQGQICRLPIHFGGVHQHHSCVSAGGGGDHVACALLVAWGVANDELTLLGAEIAVGHIDGDALLAFSRQTVGEQGQIGFALALHTGQVVLQNRFGVNQQATNQGGFAIIHRATGDEFQGGACSGADHQK